MKTEKEQEYLDRIAELEKELKRIHHKIKKDTYGLHWLDVPEAFDDDVENKLPILKEVKDKAIVNDDGKPTHILIEGDNYHALTCLNYTHKGKIDVIYIDPPYNTGTDGFKYKDKRFLTEFPDGQLVDKNHPARHSSWLSFLHKRLDISQSLIKESGMIFISIDDNEIAPLKLLCNKVFGSKNFVGQFTIQSNPRGSQASTHLADVHEYLLLYAKNIEKLKLGGFKKQINISTEYPHLDENDKHYRLLGLRQRGGEWRREQRPNMYYPIYVNPEDGSVSLSSSEKYCVESLPKRPTGEEGRWTWSKEKFNNSSQLLLGKRVNRENHPDFFDVFRKDYFLNDKDEESVSKPKTIWIDKEINYQNGRAALKQIFSGEDKFEFPKPVYYIKKILSMTRPENAIVLDYFAGSGTTAHAVMELNNDFNTKKQFILITDDENSIMTEICFPRIKKLIEGYPFNGVVKENIFEKKLNWTTLKRASALLEEVNNILNNNTGSKDWDEIKKEVKEGILRLIGYKNIEFQMPGIGNSLKYYKTEFVGEHNILGATDQDKTELAHHAGEMLAIAENTLYEMEENQTDFYQFFKNEKHFTAVYFREELEQFEKFREKVMVLEKPVSVYVFSWGENGDCIIFS